MWGEKGRLGLPHGIPGRGGGKVSTIIFYHPQTNPARLQELERLYSHAIYLQYVEAPVPVKGIIRLLEIQKNSVKDCLLHGFKLMEQLILEGGGPHPTSCPETMEAVVAFDLCGKIPVDDTGCVLPQDIHQPYALEVLATPLWDKNDRLKGTCLGQGPLLKLRLHQRKPLLPVGGIFILLTRRLLEPL